MKKVYFLFLIFLIISSCKKELPFKIANYQNQDKANNEHKPKSQNAGYEEYYQIVNFLEAYDNFRENGSILSDINITESEWLMEAAINMRYGNTTKYVINLQSDERKFEINLNTENDSLLSFEDMMNELQINMEWAQDVNDKALFFVDITYIGNGGGMAKFSITKVYGDIEELTRWHNSPIPFEQGESYGAISDRTCNVQYWGSARKKITNKINAAIGNFNSQFYNMIWINIQLAGNPITYNSYCGSCPCSPNMWGPCNKIWGSNVDGCLNTIQMNHYLNEAWNYFNSINLPPNYKKYSFLVSWTSDGSMTYINVPGGQYYSYKYQYIYVARIGKLINYPPQN